MTSSATFGLSDRAGVTNSSAYQGREYAVSRAMGAVVREAAIGAVTGGTGNAVTAARAAGATVSTATNAVNIAGKAYNAVQAVQGVVQGGQMAANGQVLAGVATAALSAVDLGPGVTKSAGAALSRSEASALRREARQEMMEAGELAAGEHAHHIVALGDKRAAGARGAMNDHGVPLSDPANRVALPSGYHQSMHTNEYYRDIERALGRANSADELRSILDGLAGQHRAAAARTCGR